MLTGTHPPFDPRVFHKEAKSLRKLGYEVTLATPSEDIVEECDREGIHLVPLPGYKNKKVRTLNLFRLIWKGLRIPAEVYHTHDLDALFASLVIKLLTGRRLVYDAHEHHASMIAENPKIAGVFKPWVEGIIVAAEESACRFVDEVITVNRTLQERYLRIGKRATVLYNCPVLREYDRWSEKNSSVPYNGRPVVVYQGSVSVDRGVDRFLFALQEVRKRCSDVVFLVAGPLLDEDQCGGRIARYVQENDLAGHFRITGWLSYEQMCAYTRSAKVGVILFQPTHYNNWIGLPNKLFEYMASGKPVVASNFPEMRRIIEEGRCGLLVDPTDPGDIARAILYLLEHSQEAEEMGRRGRKAVEERYNWEGMEKALGEVYHRLEAEYG